MTDHLTDAERALLELAAKATPADWRMNAYYYGFDATGVAAIDRVLSAVACAGKGYHNTDMWTEDDEPYHDGLRGKTPAECIQNAAADAAPLVQALPTLLATISALRGEVERLREAGRPADRFTERARRGAKS